MPLVDCPLCDHPIAFDPAADALDCAACGVWLALAPDPDPEVRIAAAA